MPLDIGIMLAPGNLYEFSATIAAWALTLIILSIILLVANAAIATF